MIRAQPEPITTNVCFASFFPRTVKLHFLKTSKFLQFAKGGGGKRES